MQGLQRHKIGLLGETFVSNAKLVLSASFKLLTHHWQINEWLSSHLKDHWDPTRHWTSRNRNHIYPNSPFTGKEKEYSDFTYPDSNGELTKLLTKFFPHDIGIWSRNLPTYHLEVKSTSESCKEPFYMSTNQFDKVLCLFMSCIDL